MDNYYTITAITLIGLITLVLRAIPFIVGEHLKGIGFTNHLGAKLPLAMMFILTFYAAGIPTATSIQSVENQVIGIAVTAFVHLTIKNYLVSIISGVVCYVFLVNDYI